MDSFEPTQDVYVNGWTYVRSFTLHTSILSIVNIVYSSQPTGDLNRLTLKNITAEVKPYEIVFVYVPVSILYQSRKTVLFFVINSTIRDYFNKTRHVY